MRKLNTGWIMALALGLAVPSFSNCVRRHEGEDREERRGRAELGGSACPRMSSRS